MQQESSTYSVVTGRSCRFSRGKVEPPVQLCRRWNRQVLFNIHDNVVAEAWENGWPIGCGDIMIIILLAVLWLVTWNT